MMIARIDFTQVAKEHCAFDRSNLRIFITDDRGNLIETRPYNSYEYDRVARMQIPIIEKLDTSSCQIPLEKVILLSRLRVK